jgi:hypothetical protein
MGKVKKTHDHYVHILIVNLSATLPNFAENQLSALKECTKPTGSPPKCTNCSGDHPANFTG